MVTEKNGTVVRLILPFVCIEFFLVILPLLTGVYYSFFDVKYFALGKFLGLRNYFSILTSTELQQSLLTTFSFTCYALAITFAIGFGMAMILQKDSLISVYMRSVIMIPYTISMLVGSMLVKWIISQDSGIIQLILSPLGLGNISILSDPGLAMMALVGNAVWRDVAFAMILLMAGLKSISDELYESARIDGAGTVAQFIYITIPLIKSIIAITIIRLSIHFVNILTYSLVLTGGAPNNATRTITLYLYKLGFEQYRFGMANALAVIMMGFNLLLIFTMLLFFREKE